MYIDNKNNGIFIMDKLNRLKQELDKDNINLNAVERSIRHISEYSNENNYEYLNSLLDPINKKGVKIPSKVPIPTCSFQLHGSLTFQPSESGYDVFLMNPFFLASEKIYDKEYAVKVNSSTQYYHFLQGSIGIYFACNADEPLVNQTPTENFFFPTMFSQVIPDVYSKYRLVSACMTVRYIGAMEEVKGTIGGGIIFRQDNIIGGRLRLRNQTDNSSGSRNPNLSDFTNRELIQDSYYFKENSCLEGIKMLYFPLDNSFNEFRKVYDGSNTYIEMINNNQWPVIKCKDDDQFKSGFYWGVYLMGVPYNGSRNFKVDFYCNYECIPNPQFMNYMPVEINDYSIAPQALKDFIDEIKKKSITKLSSFNIINNI